MAATLLYYRAEDEKGLIKQVVAIHVVGKDEVPFADEVKERLATVAAAALLKAAWKVPIWAAEERNQTSTVSTTKQKGKSRASSA